MTIEKALRQYLVGNSAVASLVGTRVYPLVLPKSPTFPAITYQRVSRANVRDLSGTSYSVSRVQFSCWAETYDEAKQVALAVQNALKDYAGLVGEVRFLDAEAVNEVDLFDPDTSLYHVPVDILVKYQGGEE